MAIQARPTVIITTLSTFAVLPYYALLLIINHDNSTISQC